jgi:hypothetical protein
MKTGSGEFQTISIYEDSANLTKIIFHTHQPFSHSFCYQAVLCYSELRNTTYKALPLKSLLQYFHKPRDGQPLNSMLQKGSFLSATMRMSPWGASHISAA